ncbi:hypothetical protein MYSTI_06894 [Myxococcus stipitatus DSM 14675]|uniref:Pvc16 N-terminal domain-containing protein n=1 Tax=Myxococcus stipitatus (strain DSM 14675 / JCM 12634 / Mx s8) TaxID=1278073 RepID=L7UKV2_MYXSD|nr:DUF4255 domain-containing protein [Myxococcus stipitatus]AGC48167.1 hypothetical protein MYSTI_06894 [Myxococcus stipitatus DSM 14675]
MSNSLAIATVTGTLITRIKGLLNGANLTEMGIRAGHPTATNNDSGVYVTLYHLSPNAALRNADLPTRRSSGETARRPVLALNLRYLLSFIGDPEKFEAERLAGLVLADLHARPLLGSDEISTYLGSLDPSHYLRQSDLARQSEPIKLSPINADAEELSRVWGMANQSFFALSMAWEATVVLLDGTVEPTESLPVASTGLAVVQATAPRLSRLYERSSRQAVVADSDTLVVEGEQLLGQHSRLFIGGGSVTLTPSHVKGRALEIDLSSVTGLVPGVLPVVVEHRVAVPGAAGDGMRPAALSNALAVMLRPTLGALSSEGTLPSRKVRIPMTPLPKVDQSVQLSLESTTTNARHTSRTFTLQGGQVLFDVPGLATGTYLVRVSVDGATSALTMTGGEYTGPTVTVP